MNPVVSDILQNLVYFSLLPISKPIYKPSKPLSRAIKIRKLTICG